MNHGLQPDIERCQPVAALFVILVEVVSPNDSRLDMPENGLPYFVWAPE